MIPIPPIPDEWSGPAKIAGASSTGSLPGCPFEALTRHSGLHFDPPVCDCECHDPQCHATIGFYNANNCEGTPATPQVVSVGCTGFTALGGMAKWATTAGCAPNGIEEISAPSWANHLRACAIFATDSTEETCAPAPAAPFQPALCISREGAGHPCPPGYENGMELYYDYQDTRDCAPDCTCTAGAVQCEDSLQIHSTANCQGGTVSNWQEGNCITSLSFPAVSYLVGSVGGSCAKSNPQAVGTVTATNPLTLCCTPPQ